MKKRVILSIVLVALLLITGCGKKKEVKEEVKVETIKVGKYTLKIGRYKTSKEDDILVLTKKGFYYEGDEDEFFDLTIGEDSLLFLDEPFFLVEKNDEIILESDHSIKYSYVGDKKNNNKDNKDDNKKDNKKDDKVKITPSEAASIKLVQYDGGEFTMNIPSGWKVSKGGTGMLYGIRVYDPNDDRNQIFYILKEQPFYKSADAESLYMLSTGYFPGIYIGGPATTEQIFKMNNTFAAKVDELHTKGQTDYRGFEFPNINNFTVIESYEGNSILHNQAVDDKVLRATFNNGSSVNDGESEGLFNACVVDFGTLGYGMDQFSYYMAYNVSGITTAKDNLINYEDILLESLNSLKFSAKYSQTTVDGINQQTNNVLNLSNQLNQAYQSYNDAWSNRQKSYDIQSQKRSDATLGYERVYDTETGEIYKAYNGFMDDYKGKRYKAISDSQYTDKVVGYIEK